ncbi:MAG: FAD:protein FMN transferase [Clostridiaceae bacterium]
MKCKKHGIMPTERIDATGRKPTTKHSKITLAAILSACLLLCGCAGKSTEPQRYEQTFFDVFDTVTTVIVYDTNEKNADAVLERAHDLLLEYHQLYDVYNAYDGMNNLYTVNQSAGGTPVTVDARILDLIEFAKEMFTLTNGRTNIAMGSVTELWRVCREAGLEDPDNAALPAEQELERASQHVNIDNVLIDQAAGTVQLADSGMLLDVGAIAKGYAVQQVIETLKSEGVTSLLISAGGNVAAIGTRPDGTNWKVGIQDPYGSGLICAVNVDAQSLVTSGTYERYYTVDGKNYHHIIDPETLYPSAYFDSVSVLCADSGLADALTTGLFCMPLEQGQQLVASLDGVEALWVQPDGTQVMSAGFGAFIIQTAD